MVNYMARSLGEVVLSLWIFILLHWLALQLVITSLCLRCPEISYTSFLIGPSSVCSLILLPFPIPGFYKFFIFVALFWPWGLCNLSGFVPSYNVPKASFIVILLPIENLMPKCTNKRNVLSILLGSQSCTSVTNVSRAKDLWNLVLPTCYDGPGLSDG